MLQRNVKQHRGFTLIELLVVIAIIAVLIGLLLPAIQSVREASFRAQCQNNLKQQGIALQMFHGANQRFPVGCEPDNSNGVVTDNWGSSWKVYILGYIEQNTIFSDWQFSNYSGYTNGNNIGMINNMTIKVYRCPSSILPAFSPYSNVGNYYEMFTTYVGIAGSYTDPSACSGQSGIVSGGGILYPNSKVRLTDITDGSSNTMIVGEQGNNLLDANNNPIPGGFGAITSQGPHGWAMGATGGLVSEGVIGSLAPPPNYQVGGDNRAFNITTLRYMINVNGMSNNCGGGTCDNTGTNLPLSSCHPNGANILFADGSVHFLGNSTPLPTLMGMATRAGGEVVSIP